MDNRADIEAELDRLQKRLSELLAELPADDVLAAFAAEAETLTRQPPAEEEAYVRGRINCMLAAAGLVPGEAEGEPCPSGD